jgi:hypothetical protein
VVSGPLKRMFDCGDATLSTQNCASDRGPPEILAACDWRGGRCALATTAILIRARLVVQVHPGPPFSMCRVAHWSATSFHFGKFLLKPGQVPMWKIARMPLPGDSEGMTTKSEVISRRADLRLYFRFATTRELKSKRALLDRNRELIHSLLLGLRS